MGGSIDNYWNCSPGLQEKKMKMGVRAVWWLLLVSCASAINMYHEIPPVDFDDYETGNDVDTTPYEMAPRNHDIEDWRTDIIFFNLLKAVQNNPGDFYRSMEYDVEPNSMRNPYTAMDFKKPFVKRVFNIKEKSKPKQRSTKLTHPRSQPSWTAKKGNFYICYFKICAFPRLTYKV